jgi:hypothetical protein
LNHKSVRRRGGSREPRESGHSSKTRNHRRLVEIGLKTKGAKP